MIKGVLRSTVQYHVCWNLDLAAGFGMHWLGSVAKHPRWLQALGVAVLSEYVVRKRGPHGRCIR